jgi:hypothetical protein
MEGDHLEDICRDEDTIKMDLKQTDPVSEMSCFFIFTLLDDGHSPKTQ